MASVSVWARRLVIVVERMMGECILRLMVSREVGRRWQGVVSEMWMGAVWTSWDLE